MPKNDPVGLKGPGPAILKALSPCSPFRPQSADHDALLPFRIGDIELLGHGIWRSEAARQRLRFSPSPHPYNLTR